MKDQSLFKLGGICAILVGISYVVVGITYLLMPAEQKSGIASQYLLSFAKDPTMSLLEYWAFALGAIFALAAVLAVSESLRSENDGWLRWTSILAIIGFALTATGYFRHLTLDPHRAAAFAQGDASTRFAIAWSQASVTLDSNAWFSYGGVGLWLFVVNSLALRRNLLPKPLTYVGIVGAVAYWIALAGNILSVPAFNAIAAVAAAVLGPIWFVWVGLRLRQEAIPSLEQEGSASAIRQDNRLQPKLH